MTNDPFTTMSDEPRTIRAPFRLALRLEGNWYNAYFAKHGTMEGSELLGSVALRLVENAACRHKWQQCMSDLFEQIIRDTGLTVDHMIKEDAPPHERAGNA